MHFHFKHFNFSTDNKFAYLLQIRQAPWGNKALQIMDMNFKRYEYMLSCLF